MRSCIYNTDREWINTIRERAIADGANFWRKDQRKFNLPAESPFYFKLRGTQQIAGRALFRSQHSSSTHEAWNQYGYGNGVKSEQDLTNRASEVLDITRGAELNCLILDRIELLPDGNYIELEDGEFPPSIMGGKFFDSLGIARVEKIFDSHFGSQPQTEPNGINWQSYHAYRAFGEFIKSVVVDQRSYITKAHERLDISNALLDIKQRFVEGFDASEESFEEKLNKQFEGASTNTKLLFSNIEYVWGMPVKNISAAKKRSYATRWFSGGDIIDGPESFFSENHTIANPGSYYLLNKYFEMVALLSLLEELFRKNAAPTLDEALSIIEEFCYLKIYHEDFANSWTGKKRKCSVYPTFLHLAAPDKYLPIISDNHKQRIDAVFEYALGGESIACREQRLLRIQENLYDSYAYGVDPDVKRKWFFYQPDVKRLWIDKKGKRQQHASSIEAELSEEDTADELEGQKGTVTGTRLKRSGKLVAKAKKRDGYTCVSCGFHYKKQIVQAHHLDPLSERKEPRKTTLDDLITLCPTCHYMAHYLLRNSEQYKERETLVRGLRMVLK